MWRARWSQHGPGCRTPSNETWMPLRRGSKPWQQYRERGILPRQHEPLAVRFGVSTLPCVCVCACECARSQARRSLAFVTDQIARTKIYNAIRTSFSPMNLARLRCMQYCVVACDRVVVCITLSVYLVIVRIIAYFLVNNHLYEYATAYKYYNRHIVSL